MNWSVTLVCSAEGKRGSRDNWWGSATGKDDAESKALSAMATKHGTKITEWSVEESHQAKSRD